MVKVIRSIGQGLCAAGATLLVIYFLVVRLKGLDALYEAVNPLAPRTYLVFSAMIPGALCLWLANHLSSRRRRTTVVDDTISNTWHATRPSLARRLWATGKPN
jgi:hypothetical protein